MYPAEFLLKFRRANCPQVRIMILQNWKQTHLMLRIHTDSIADSDAVSPNGCLNDSQNDVRIILNPSMVQQTKRYVRPGTLRVAICESIPRQLQPSKPAHVSVQTDVAHVALLFSQFKVMAMTNWR
ncbi:hypothetical protein M758_1G099100 [Ceratodon purpureus]|uniref:Uncharacterized protein n=1 Tax=Ceratodon purpureus TaxID=3225 RepID=A0A8T0J6V4_CERPU|nr:hypothetical protein KC19_1G109800 [Ceratodon purpureus]KAG0629381.1 hypothetical protein M758_1G099100 [Ceratodon purpureus]